MSKSRKVIYVEWEDHWGSGGGWAQPENVESKPLTCYTIGFLVKEDKKGLTLALSHDGQGAGSCHSYILKNCIKKRKAVSV